MKDETDSALGDEVERADTLADRLSKLIEAKPEVRERKYVVRSKSNATPDKLLSVLTKEQRISFSNLEFFGWKIWFVRRPLFFDPQVLLINEDSGLYGLLMKDGNLDMDPKINIRR